MDESMIKKIARLLDDYYNGPHFEKIPLPLTKQKVKKVIQVKEERTVITKEKVKNNMPGNVAWVLALLCFPLGVFILGTFIYAAIAFAVAGVVLHKFVKKKVDKETKEIVEVPKTIEEEVFDEQQYELKPCDGKYKVKAISKVKLDFSVVAIQGSKLLLYENGKPNKQLDYPVIDKAISYTRLLQKQADALNEIPAILFGAKTQVNTEEVSNYGKSVPLRGHEQEIMEFFHETVRVFSRKKKKSIELPVVEGGNLSDFLVKSDKNHEKGYADVLNGLINSDEGFGLDQVLANWTEDISRKIDHVNDVRLFSLDKELSKSFLTLGQTSHYSSFNFYCPDCNKEAMDRLLKKNYSVMVAEIDERTTLSRNTRCYYLLDENLWGCPVCKAKIVKPIPIHKTLDEVIMPAYDKLMEEHKVERDKRYSETRSKELEYRKEYKTRVDELNYSNLNHIMSLEDEMDRMRAEIEGQREAIVYINKVAKDYNEISSDLLARIEDETAAINEVIARRADEVSSALREFTQNELAGYSERMDELSKAKRIDDERKEMLVRDIATTVRENTTVLQDVGGKIVGAVNENTAATIEAGEKVAGAVDKNTTATVQAGERIESVVKEQTQATKQGMESIVQANHETRDQMKKNYALNAAVAKKQGHKVDDVAFYRLGAKVKGSLRSMGSTIKGHSAVEREVELNK